MARNNWTKESIIEIAKQYPNVKAWKLGNMPSYQAAQRYKILKECRALLSNELHRSWTVDELKEDAKKHSTKIEWLQSRNSAYNIAYDLGILEDCCKHMDSNRIYWTKEEVINIAKEYTRIADWRNGHHKSYDWAHRNGMIKECTSHMKRTWAHSKPELELLEWVRQYYPEATSLKTKTLALDIYVKELNLGIEYNGCFYHSEWGGKDSNYHINKTNYFNNMGISVVHIWSYEWRDSREQVKNFLLSKLKVAKTVGARKCDFKEIPKTEARDFCNKNHIQGSTININYAIGCFYENELIGVATFSPHHRGGAEIALSRLCFNSKIHVAGALSKFSKMAAQFYKKNIITWVHRTLSDGSSYVKSGWEVVSISKPDYFYLYGSDNIISKQSRKKSVVKTPEGMTESEHAKIDGLNRVYDCGKIKLVYKYAQ